METDETVTKPPHRDGHFFWTLFKSTFIISAFTVGGGFVIIPLLKAKYVDEYHWISDKETLDMVAIAQSMPGVIAVNSAVILGYRMAWCPGHTGSSYCNGVATAHHLVDHFSLLRRLYSKRCRPHDFTRHAVRGHSPYR
jgi:hypothetical protein